MFANFLSLCGDFAKTKLDPAAAYGGFSTQRNVAVSVGQGSFTSKRRFLCKDKYTALGDVEVAITAPVHDPRGYNTEIIAENGDIGPDLFAAKLRSAGGLPKDVLQLVHADIDKYIWDDSQISLLVSLMSTMYVLQAKELGVDKEQLSYDDGHVSFTLADQLCEQVQHGNWMVDEQIAVLNWDQVFHNEFSHANIMCTTGLAPKSIQILAAHMSGRNKTTGYSFDLQIPKLASVVMMTKTPPNDIDLSRVTSKDVKAALDSYVKMNRLEGAFEAAYAIYLQTAIRPVPDTAEGMAWLLRKRTLVLPAFSAHRGLYSVLLRDRPFGISSAVTTTLKLWRDVGLAFAVQGAMFTAVSLWGRYFVEAGFYHNDAEVERLGSYDFGTSPSAAYYCYATLVTGHDTYCPLPRNIGVQYDPWNSDTLMEYDVDVQDADITGYDIVVDGDRRALRVTEVPQPCSTVHVMGRMPNSGHFKCLSNNFKLHFARVEEGFEVANVATAWGVGLATRWLGFDTEMEYRGKSRIANWASNDTSMAARPFSVRGPDRKSVTIRGFLPRKKVYAQLPPVGYDEFDWDVTFHIDDAYTVSTLTKTRIMTRSSFYPPTQGDQKIIEVDYQNTMYTPVTLRVNSRANVEQTGFQVLPPQTSHNPPDPIRPSAQEDEASGEEQEGDHG